MSKVLLSASLAMFLCGCLGNTPKKDEIVTMVEKDNSMIVKFINGYIYFNDSLLGEYGEKSGAKTFLIDYEKRSYKFIEPVKYDSSVFTLYMFGSKKYNFNEILVFKNEDNSNICKTFNSGKAVSAQNLINNYKNGELTDWFNFSNSMTKDGNYTVNNFISKDLEDDLKARKNTAISQINGTMYLLKLTQTQAKILKTICKNIK